jgi:FkbM family methyltransferase
MKMSAAPDLNSYIEALDLESDLKRRIRIAAGSRDCDYIPKVPGAGEIFPNDGQPYQLMHNGVKVVEDGYCGRWMTEIIRLLRGHHEPQEEKVFYEVLKHLSPGATMVELGSYWGYYSLWFQRAIAGAHNYLIEPDLNNLKIGEENFRLNSAQGKFFQFTVGREPLPPRPFVCESDGTERMVAETSVDQFMSANGIERCDLLFSDIQGAELSMLEGAAAAIRNGNLRFLFLSTHHHTISQDPLTHQRCLAWLKDHGAHIIAAHNVTESYSGDGLIVVSFDDRDRSLPEIEISKNHPTNSLYRELEYDLDDAQRELLSIKKSRGFKLISALHNARVRVANLFSSD